MTAGANLVPVVAIDGPTASGKGVVSASLAGRLGWHYLDSGALYRLAALAAVQAGTDLDDATALADLAGRMPVRFDADRIYLGESDVTDLIRQTRVGAAASRIAAIEPLRHALLDRQKRFRQAPGLVADGRDMGTVVFPDAVLKVFLTAAVEVRAQRRHKQLIEKGFSAKLPDLLQDLRERDQRDSERSASPLIAAQDAIQIDSSARTLDDIVGELYLMVRSRC